MSQLNAQFVKQGFWVDNTRGSILGQTITTTTKTGNLVVALMAVLTTLGINHLWSLVIFGYHQMRVKNSPKDGLLVQQQALMRTLPGPFAMLTDWLKLWWVWRKRVNRALIRCVSIVFLAIIFATLTIAVGTFSSYLADGTNIIMLVQSPYCGPVDFFGEDIEGPRANFSIWAHEYMEKVADLADAYTRDCYANRTAVPERCRIFTRPTLPFQQQRVACPFEPSMCKNISEPGLAIDTGLLDLDEYFGFNLAASEKAKFRRKATCAVMELDGHYEILNASDTADFEQNSGRAPWVGERAMRINLGTTEAVNYTYSVLYMPEERENMAKVHMAFDYPSPYWKEIGGTFDPIPGIQNNKSDLVVFFVITRGTRWRTAVNDPLYSAHRVFKHRMTDNSTMVSYTSDSVASAFGCQYQYQFCYSQNPQSDNCTDLGGLPTSWDFPGANGIQQALLKLLVRTVYMNSADTGANHITPSTLGSGFNLPLPDDQWASDFVALEKNIGTQMQIALSTYAIGLSTLDLSISPPMRKNQTEADKQLCGLQRMQSPGGFVNIYVFALAFVMTFCVIVTTLDLVLLKFLIFWHQFRGILAPRIDAWVEDGIFQLQRRAYEAYGQGTWERPDKEVPITTDKADLVPFDLKSKVSCQCTHILQTVGDPLSTATSMASKPDTKEKIRTAGLDTTC